ncbi:MAG TPA: DUF167 domain-containing protein [Micromonosporaceae bacterium]|jgi:hypothetical protein
MAAQETSLTVPVRVKPGVSRASVGGRHDGPLGPALIVAVNAPAVDGRATEAARRALARALDVRPASVTLRSGGASRDKLFQVADPPDGLAGRLRDLRDHPPARPRPVPPA